MAWLTLATKRECWRKRRDAHLDRYVRQVERDEEDRGSLIERLSSPGAGLEERIAERDQARRRASAT